VHVILKDILIPGLKTIAIDALMVDAEEIIKIHKFRHLPVTDGREIVGILSDRDIQRATTVIVSSENKIQTQIHRTKKVSEFMSSPVFKAKSSERIEKVTREMIDRKLSCVIVVDELGSDVGIITTEDLMILLLDILEKQETFTDRVRKLLQKI